jgi:hypothetical protein
MKPIYEYILNKDTKVIKTLSFPQSQKISDYIDFLEANNFKELIDDNVNLYDNIVSKFRKCQDKCYMIHAERKWIRFKNKGEITNKNPLFFIFVNNDGKEQKYGAINDYVVGFIDNNINVKSERYGFYTYKEFLNYVNKIFNE